MRGPQVTDSVLYFQKLAVEEAREKVASGEIIVDPTAQKDRTQ